MPRRPVRRRGVEVVLVGDHLHGRAGARREVLAEGDLSVAGGGLAEHELGLRDAGGLQLGKAQACRAEHEGGEDPQRARTPTHCGRDPTPCPVGGQDRVLVGPPRCGARLVVRQGAARPERDAPAQQQRRGSSAASEHRAEDPERCDGAQCTGGAQVRQQQAQQSRDHGPARGEDRLDRAAQRRAGRLGATSMGAQLVAISRDVQQRVVGRRADHEDEQDALGLPGQQQHAGVRQVPDRQQRHAQGRHRRREHDQRQERGAVDEHEDDEHRRESDPEQQAVDPCEGLAEICGEPRGPGDVRVEGVGEVRVQGVGDVGGDRAEIRVRVQGHEGLDGQAVLRGQGGGDLRAHPLQGGEVLEGVGDLRRGVLVDLLGRGDHDDRGDRVRARELRRQVGDLGRLRGIGKIGGRVVGGDLVDPSEVRPAHGRAEEPDEDQQRRQHEAQQAREPTSATMGVPVGAGVVRAGFHGPSVRARR